MPFSLTWNPSFEASPPDNEVANLLGQRLREFKSAVRERLEVEHDWPDGTGRHKFGRGDLAARDAILTPPDGMIWFRTDRNTLDLRTGGAWKALTLGSMVAADSPLVAEFDRSGPLWIDPDDNKLYLYDHGSATWKGVVTSAAASGVPTGAIMPYAAATAGVPPVTPPGGFFYCDGGVKDRVAEAALFGVIGTQYGTTLPTNFLLPNLKGRLVCGFDSGITMVNAVGRTTPATYSSDGGDPVYDSTIKSGSVIQQGVGSQTLASQKDHRHKFTIPQMALAWIIKN